MITKIAIDKQLIYFGSKLTFFIEMYMSTHNMLNVGKINGKRYILYDGTCIYIHNTKKQIIVEKL
jgi:hypothetical protein